MISIIVPVYNMENYLARCIDSLLCQSVQDFEILLIDDGSTDKSSVICKEYAERDNRIRYIKKNNGGLSDTRNVAIELSKGEFVTFVDSDDFVHNTYLEYLLALIRENSADISSCIHFETFNDVFNADMGENRSICMSGHEACERMMKDLAPVLTAACGKLYRTEIVRKYKFPYGRLHEDVATTFKYYLDSNKVVYGYKKLYAYFQHPNSIMHTISNKKVEDELWAMSERALCLKKLQEPELEEIAWEFMSIFLKKDVMEKIGETKTWKKYGRLYIKNSSRLKAKFKIGLLTYFPMLGRYYFKKKKKKC